MAFSTHLPMALFLSSLLFHAALGEFVCEELSVDVCAFSIASSGKRCLLETTETTTGELEYQCRTSEVVVERMAGYVESDRCIDACGLDRSSIGISSDALLEPEFTANLCSPTCFHSCPNVVDLYFNLASGEGVFLPDLCERQRSNTHRKMAELKSYGYAPGPHYGSTYGYAPGPYYGSSYGSSPGPISDLPISPAPAPIYTPPISFSPAPAPVYGHPISLPPAPAPVYAQPISTPPASAPVYGQPISLPPAPAAAPTYGLPISLPPAPAPTYGSL